MPVAAGPVGGEVRRLDPPPAVHYPVQSCNPTPQPSSATAPPCTAPTCRGRPGAPSATASSPPPPPSSITAAATAATSTSSRPRASPAPAGTLSSAPTTPSTRPTSSSSATSST